MLGFNTYNWTIPMASGRRLYVMFQYSEIWDKKQAMEGFGGNVALL